MKKFIILFLFFINAIFLFSLESKPKLDENQKEADKFYKEGIAFQNNFDYTKAVSSFNKAIQSERKSKKPRAEIILDLTNGIGNIYYYQADYDAALKYYKVALNYSETNKIQMGIAAGNNNIAMVYYLMGDFKKALDFYSRSFELSKTFENTDTLGVSYCNLGMVHGALNDYDKSLYYYQQALEIFKKKNSKSYLSWALTSVGGIYYGWGRYDLALDYYIEAEKLLNNTTAFDTFISVTLCIGECYMAWGKYDKAEVNFNKALNISDQTGINSYIARIFNDLGRCYEMENNFDKAINAYKNSLSISESIGRKDEIANILGCLGKIALKTEKIDYAKEFYDRALKVSMELGRKDIIATAYIQSGFLEMINKKYESALKYYNDALEISLSMGLKIQTVSCYESLGICYAELNNSDEAIKFYLKAIQIKEELRLTAKGSDRRDYLSSQIISYQNLISLYFNANSFEKSFDYYELSKAKYLSEQIKEKSNDKNFKYSGLKNFQKNLPPDTAVIAYSNFNWDKPIIFIIDNQNFKAERIDSAEFLSCFSDDKIKKINSNHEIERGLKITKELTPQKKNLNSIGLDNFINYYRILLTTPDLKEENLKDYKNISNKLYKFLIGKIEKNISDKKNLIIIPDNILGFIPFESLITDEGKYFIEKYNIKYIQSITVNELLLKRNYNNNKSILAFGGADYNSGKKSNFIMPENPDEIKSMIAKTNYYLTRGSKLNDLYRDLGINGWENLPGTVAEVENIKNIFQDSTIIKGQQVNETAIKNMSKSGDLKKYKMLHFATHAFVMDILPELSAMVLSLNNNSTKEDGYLNIKEISELNINSDFVNLSACETGLGKIYGGEDVVGLTQSFLVAGANGISVSLWEIADISTSKFMTLFYTLLKEKKLTYSEALTEAKREFLKDPKYNNPYYWSGFVYYGR